MNKEKDQYHLSKDPSIGHTMWLLDSSGVSIFTPDGKERKRFTPPEDICHDEPPPPPGGGYNPFCRFYDAVSDGKKYVWAAVSRGLAKIAIFDIDTGAMVGAFETCKTPGALEYHPLRDEVWVRCYDLDEDSKEPTNIDVFSASTPSVNIQTDILLKNRTHHEDLSSRGVSIVDDSLGDVGYVTDRDLPYLFKLDLSDKTIVDKFEFPDVHGLYEASYSPVNKHVFVRPQLCCTCGFEGADLGASCGRGPGDNVTVTTGPFKYVSPNAIEASYHKRITLL